MIAVGDALPSGTLHHKTAAGIEAVDPAEFLGAGKAVLFAVPGAFTPTCSDSHVPGYIAQAQALRDKGVTKVACVAVNDAFVLAAWSKALGAEGTVEMLADGNGDYARALGLELDLTAKGLGKRFQRCALVLDNGKVTHLAVDEGGALDVSSAEAVLALL
ncbi:peroxiredoxin [Rhodospirillum rubrum]|uniref:Glutathione-dependent peroxiredoxin n=1 Tax=Rhodospirillum rubrum (strain ATCC 11170 / ATH 1.1.1 / DSM 467 / LMG 4362 / NCIMB 8255 / S1) TaxID=269796 RepID=Q2RPU3_RHORT|nr:peroxiredoxin [Rhodospirillum rubrum]ABC23852.1 Alkyl hydroperoxide reductase/ Thiol specific antioxidant/ Mal allergen [Rhodospirillum rubrum ATCC 11170]AEO49594.1 alkyl hydroperoxide reductase/ Thiol specific antioxidant/ Mal allergen [Rhodospirillum rubrum F11]MBK5955529.1 peroxiredoxin [Rhodospirillum rubrum]QXG79799.1 peroxiredoxin [Rhodospirillum rubrum]